MTDAQLYKELSYLPDSLKKEVIDFIAFLKQKTQPKEKKTRTLGLAKGKIVIKDNFDDPIPGFEKYQ
jgi:predicted AAA+ superfamily ATPase